MVPDSIIVASDRSKRRRGSDAGVWEIGQTPNTLAQSAFRPAPFSKHEPKSGELTGLGSFMSFQMTRAAWMTRCESSTQMLVLLALADFADDKGDLWPSGNTLANKTMLSRSTVKKEMASFVKRGLLKRMDKGGGKKSAAFRLLLTCPVNGHPPVRYADNPVRQADTPCPVNGHNPIIEPIINLSGGRKAPVSKKFIREIDSQIATLKEMRKHLKDQNAHDNAFGLDWGDKLAAKQQYVDYGKRIKELEREKVEL